MYDDPIIEEIRQVREQMASKFDFNVHAIFEDLRQRQTSLGARLVNKTKETGFDGKELSARKNLHHGR